MNTHKNRSNDTVVLALLFIVFIVILFNTNSKSNEYTGLLQILFLFVTYIVITLYTQIKDYKEVSTVISKSIDKFVTDSIDEYNLTYTVMITKEDAISFCFENTRNGFKTNFCFKITPTNCQNLKFELYKCICYKLSQNLLQYSTVTDNENKANTSIIDYDYIACQTLESVNKLVKYLY